MNRALKIMTFVLCLSIAAYGQERCGLHSLAGTYAISERGSSVTIDPSSVGVLSPAPTAPASPPAWTALGFVPFGNIGEVTFWPLGTGDGYFWIWAGSVRATLTSIPVHLTVTEMNEDCTGKFQYSLANGAVIEERFILFDDGRQFRTVPTTLASPGIPTLAWIGSGHRIDSYSGPANSCSLNTALGRYLMTCENIIRSGIYPTKAVSDTFLLRMEVFGTGVYKGTLYEKYGATKVELPVYGTMEVNRDCSFTDTLNIPAIASTVIVKGVFYDEGKQFYAMGILNPTILNDQQQSIQYSLCQGTRIGPKETDSKIQLQ